MNKTYRKGCLACPGARGEALGLGSSSGHKDEYGAVHGSRWVASSPPSWPSTCGTSHTTSISLLCSKRFGRPMDRDYPKKKIQITLPKEQRTKMDATDMAPDHKHILQAKCGIQGRMARHRPCPESIS